MKTKKFVAILSIALGCSFTGNSQTYKDFDLSSFITPDIVRNELDFSLNSSGDISDYKAHDNDKASLNANFTTKFSRLKNTRPYIGEQQASFSFRGLYTNDRTYTEKNKETKLTFSYSTANRFYKPNKFFYSLNGSAYLDYNRANNKKVDETKQKGSYFTAFLGIGIGKGRIEPVTDARQAVYIVEQLSEKGVLDRKLTDDEILALAKKIAIVKNKRFFDSRLHLINEITSVDSFFVQNHLIKSAGANYFTTLYDYWMYGDRFQRSAGLEFYAGLFSNYNHTFNKYNDGIPNKTNRYTPMTGAELSLTYENPKNLYWQQSARASLLGYYCLEDLEFDTSKEKNNCYQANFSGSYGWGYYPTSRTNMNLSLQQDIYWSGSKRKEGESKLYDKWNSYTHLIFSTYYYFSPQLRLEAEATGGLTSVSTEKIVSPNDKRLGWTGSFQLTLTYSLF